MVKGQKSIRRASEKFDVRAKNRSPPGKRVVRVSITSYHTYTARFFVARNSRKHTHSLLLSTSSRRHRRHIRTCCGLALGLGRPACLLFVADDAAITRLTVFSLIFH